MQNVTRIMLRNKLCIKPYHKIDSFALIGVKYSVGERRVGVRKWAYCLLRCWSSDLRIQWDREYYVTVES